MAQSREAVTCSQTHKINWWSPDTHGHRSQPCWLSAGMLIVVPGEAGAGRGCSQLGWTPPLYSSVRHAELKEIFAFHFFFSYPKAEVDIKQTLGIPLLGFPWLGTQLPDAWPFLLNIGTEAVGPQWGLLWGGWQRAEARGPLLQARLALCSLPCLGRGAPSPQRALGAALSLSTGMPHLSRRGAAVPPFSVRRFLLSPWREENRRPRRALFSFYASLWVCLC